MLLLLNLELIKDKVSELLSFNNAPPKRSDHLCSFNSDKSIFFLLNILFFLFAKITNGIYPYND